MQRKILSLMLLSLVGSNTTAMAFTDSINHWADFDIEKLVEMNILEGYENGNFNPDGFITRAEASKVLTLAKQFDIQNKADLNIKDMDESHWSYDYVLTLVKNGVAKGYPDGSFKPDNNISREEFSIMIFNILNPKSEKLVEFKDIGDSFANNEIQRLAGLGILSGYEGNLFKPKEKITRAEAASIVSKTLKVLSEENIENSKKISKENNYTINEESNKFIPSPTAQQRSLSENEINLMGNEDEALAQFKEITLKNIGSFSENISVSFEEPVNQEKLEASLREVIETNYEGARIKNISRMSQISNHNGSFLVYRMNYKFEYFTTQEEENYIDREVENIVNSIIEPNMDIQTKAKTIYDYIIKNTSYASNYKQNPFTPEGFSVYSPMAAIKSRKAVCNGYAGLFYKMAKIAGLNVEYESGKALTLNDEEKHAWNKVEVNGEWRYIDTTWADNENENINYNYFLVDRDTFARDHTIR